MIRVVRVVVLTGFLLLMVAPSALAATPTLRLGQSRTFLKGQIVPGQKIVCVGGGKKISARVPQPRARTQHPALTFGITWIRGISIEIDSTANGTYFVSCV